MDYENLDQYEVLIDLQTGTITLVLKEDHKVTIEIETPDSPYAPQE